MEILETRRGHGGLGSGRGLVVFVAVAGRKARGRGKYRPLLPGRAAGIPRRRGSVDRHQDLNDNGNVVGSYRNSTGVQCGFHYQHAAAVPYTSLGAGVAARGLNQSDELVGSERDAEYRTLLEFAR